MHSAQHHLERISNAIPLSHVAQDFAAATGSPAARDYLAAILRRCPRGKRSLEVGTTTGYGVAWLALRGVAAVGIGTEPAFIDRAGQVGHILGANTHFAVADPFQLFQNGVPVYGVIHHAGFLSRLSAPWIRAALAQQVAMAEWVVFAVPSAYSEIEPDTTEDRLLPLDEWERLITPFDVAELRYIGDPSSGARDQILVVLRGQPLNADIENLMTVPDEPYPFGISAIVQTRNEAHQIADCLATLQGWTDEIVVCDMDSDDGTIEIAQRFTDRIIRHPHLNNFDRARNVSAMRAQHRWVFYLDADERVPPRFGPALRDLLGTQGDTFDALLVPFRHRFSGRWMRSLYPGYTAPRVLKNGRFFFRSRLHEGPRVDGRIACFPANDPGLAIDHYSYRDLAHYLEKLNLYTDGEAQNMDRDGTLFNWQAAVAHFAQDLKQYYDGRQAGQDGVHGFLYSFLSAFYRFEQHAKLFERRARDGRLQPEEVAIPNSAEEIVAYALAVLRREPAPLAPEVRIETSKDAAPVVWSGPFYSPSGYGDECRSMLFGVEDAGANVVARPLPWWGGRPYVTPADDGRLAHLSSKVACPGFTHIVHAMAPTFERYPGAGISIGRTMFETDRLPPDWAHGCNIMDRIWVPSEFNRRTFAQSGVSAETVVVVPGAIDPAAYTAEAAPASLVEKFAVRDGFVFLSVFEWMLRKGWDVLLSAFIETFEGCDNVRLLLKTFHPGRAEIAVDQAVAYVRDTMGHDLLSDERITFLTEFMPPEAMHALYRSADAFVLPSRGEGWGRPYMESMVCGKPVIGTNGSGNVAFMSDDNSYLIDCVPVDVPESGWREVGTYRGHQWLEPSREHLKKLMRRVYEERGEAEEIGRRAREDIVDRFNQVRVGRQILNEIQRTQEEMRPHPVSIDVSLANNDEGGTEKRHALSVAKQVAVRWEGAQFVRHSLAYVNRELCLNLLESGRTDLSVVPSQPDDFDPEEDPRFLSLARQVFSPLGRPADVHVRHFFPPRLDPPSEGQLVLILAWEYGTLPCDWTGPIRENVAEVWCHSEYVRQVYLASGIPEKKLRIIPHGVDPEVFSPSAPPYVFTTEPGVSRVRGSRPFRFLYVGGTIHRKGFDILLDTYLKAFSAYDDACLVVKDMGTRTFYQGQNSRERILELTNDPSRPRIVYIEDDLPPHTLAGLYAACDCLIQPYRGEAFCLPALEALACGTPVVVTEGGPTDDFVDDTVGWRVPAERRPVDGGRVGPWQCVPAPWLFEVSPDDLARVMRDACTHPTETALKGKAGIERVRGRWTWRHAAATVLDRLDALKDAPNLTTEQRVSTAAPAQNESTERKRTRSTKGTNVGTSSWSRGRSGSKVPLRGDPTVSLCMIVRNEERVLGKCLESIKPWVDEMIVVDTGSTDRTVEIAEGHAAKVFRFPWCDDFSAARNASLEHATGDWILWMDADDTIRPECGQRLHETAFLAADTIMGFLMQVHVPPAPGESGLTVVDHVKLFRNQPLLRFEGRIHEQILESIYRAGGSVARSDVFVVHSGYDYSPEGQRRKRERDLRLLDLDLRDRPDHPFVLFNIGMTAFHLRDFARALPALERCLAVSKPHESTVRKVYAMLAGCHLERGELDRAKARIEEGARHFPRDPEILFRAGIIYREAGDLVAAERSYVRLLTEREDDHIDSLDVSITSFKAHHNLGLIYQDMGRNGEAESQWRSALSANPAFIPSLVALGELYVRLRRFRDAQEVADKVRAIDPSTAQRLANRIPGS